MRIGILTQPLKGNYGGLLQNYALQQVLRMMGHDPVTLDFQPGFSGLMWARAQTSRIAAKLLGADGDWRIEYAPFRSNRIINEFIEKHITHTHTFWNRYSKSLIARYGLDAVIVGSDQVWRPLYNFRLEDSFLGFTGGCDIRRVAYAASFGTDVMELSEKQQQMAKTLLARFDAVSVREKSGERLAAKLDTQATWVLDPTLLLGRKGFDTLAVDTHKHNYLGYYILDDMVALQTEITRIQTVAGIPESCGLTENTADCGPGEWIGLIRNSNLFLTDSFHGTVFCLLYHIPFYTVLNAGRGADRFHSLLTPLGLEHRLVNSLSEIIVPDVDIDWTDIDRRIDSQRDASQSFLTHALG